MAKIIGLVSQKGGVGKSTLARAIAVQFAKKGQSVKLADLDVKQATSYRWSQRRLEGEIEPYVSVECYRTVGQAMSQASNYDVLLLDGVPQADKTTLQIAQVADIMILPSGLSLDDLVPTVMLANSLMESGISSAKINFALCRTGDSKAEFEEAVSYLKATPYHLLVGQISEKTAFRRAQDEGLSVIECRYTSPRRQAQSMAKAILDRLDEIHEFVNS